MSEWKDLAEFMFGDVHTDRGFWYSHLLYEIDGMTEDQLFWVPDPKSLCILWHVGHIAHRERVHIGRFLEGLQGEIIPSQYNIFGTEWCAVEMVRESIDSVPKVLDWVREVREASNQYISSLNDADFFAVPRTSEFELPVAHWLFITSAHTALHIGRIQLLRALIEGEQERAC